MKVYVGLSGGVDSSVTAALLKQQGHDVTGVYMKNWSQDLPGHHCPWEEDYKDAKRVATRLGIEFKTFDFQKQYKQEVVNYMIAEYQYGRTPNPDVMCNQEIKFKLFLDTAMEQGADAIATGHYAKTRDGELHTAEDKNKDQTYFLYRVSSEALSRSMMPIGEIGSKDEVRNLAKKLNLPTAEKKDSQGICFVGQVGIKDFLVSELGPQKPGDIIDSYGCKIGEHDGAIFYTIGQRHGLNIGGGLPYYVTKKDMKSNTVHVTTDLDDKDLWSKEVRLEDIHWINEPPEKDHKYQVRLRYRGPLVGCRVDTNKLILDEEQRAMAAGQSAVLYDGSRCMGGGVISSTS